MTGFTPLSVPDVPAEEPGEDFKRYAGVLATMLRKAEPPRLTVGIFGGYGSGKTTLLNAIKKKLDAANSPQEPVVTVFFEAWRYDQEPHLFLPFLSALARSKELAPSRSVRKSLAAGVRSLLYGLSFDLGVVRMSAKDALDRKQSLKKKDVTAIEKLAGGYDDIVSALRGLVQEGSGEAAPRRIVVLIDDLDRCFPGKALGLLEAMKSFMDIPGYLFVIALDPRVIARYLAGKYGKDFGISADEYLEKMVQVPFHLPRLEPQAVMEQIDAVLTEIAVRAGSAVWTGAVRQSLKELEKYLPRNMRQAKRILNMHQSILAARPELNSDVLLALLILQMRWRLAYWALQTYRTAFHGYFLTCEGREPGPDAPEVLTKHESVLAELRDEAMRSLYMKWVYQGVNQDIEKLPLYLDLMGWPVDTEARLKAEGAR